MPNEISDRRLFALFGRLLDYPAPGLAETAQACAELVAPRRAEAAAQLEGFGAFAATTPPGKIEEIYTGTFDLEATCHPYVGYHLFGESYKRSLLLVGLRERYRAAGFEPGSELPDHVSVLLRYLGSIDDPEESQEIVRSAILPALPKIIGGEAEEPAASDAPAVYPAVYRQVLRALWQVLAPQDGAAEPELAGAAAGSGEGS